MHRGGSVEPPKRKTAGGIAARRMRAATIWPMTIKRTVWLPATWTPKDKQSHRPGHSRLIKELLRDRRPERQVTSLEVVKEEGATSAVPMDAATGADGEQLEVGGQG